MPETALPAVSPTASPAAAELASAAPLSPQSLPPALHWLRVTGLIEGTSTLALFGVAMPLKYAADMPLAVTIVGGIHGGLFVLYLAVLLLIMTRHRWPIGRGVALFVAAVVPFGPFIMDRRIPRWHAADLATGRAPAQA